MAYDPENDKDMPVAAMPRPMPDPDSYMTANADDEAPYKDPRPQYGKGMNGRITIDTEVQLEGWVNELAEQNGQFQAEHSEVEDQLRALEYQKAILEAKIRTVHSTARTVSKILDDHRRQMDQASVNLERSGRR